MLTTVYAAGLARRKANGSLQFHLCKLREAGSVSLVIVLFPRTLVLRCKNLHQNMCCGRQSEAISTSTAASPRVCRENHLA